MNTNRWMCRQGTTGPEFNPTRCVRHREAIGKIMTLCGLVIPLVFGALIIFGAFNRARAASSREKGIAYLEKAIHKFDGIKDYVVDVKVHMDMKGVQMPDMEAKVYFKEPDKIKINSKGLFFMPKDVGVINPRNFNPNKFEIALIDTLTYNGNPAAQLSLVPKSDESGNKNIFLTIDMKDWIIVQIATSPSPGREASAKIKYGMFDGFQMPVEVKVHLDVRNLKGEGRMLGPEHGRLDQLNGNVDIFYSNYRINTNLPDKIFEKKVE